MIGTIRKHNKLLWAVLVPVTILSFVWYFFPNNRNHYSSDDGSRVNLGKINGEPINVSQFQQAMQEGKIFMRLNYGEWPDSSQEKSAQLHSFAEQRLLMGSLMDQYHISVSSDATARFVRQILGIKADENVPPAKIVEELTKITKEGGVTLDDFDRFARHQLGQEYLIALVGMSGKLITPQEAEFFFRRENEPIEAEMVTFPVSDYVGQINPSDAEIEDYYSKNQATYRVPEKLVVNYVQFDASNYLDKVPVQVTSNLDGRINEEYTQAIQGNPAAFKDESGKALPPDEAKAKIKKQTLRYYSLLEARKAANAFVEQLTQGHDEQHPYTPEDLAKVAQARHATVQTTAPFDVKNPPKELAATPKALRAVFLLRADDADDKEHAGLYAPSPVVGEDSVYVVGLKERQPSAIQPLAAVRAKVVEDYRQGKAADMAKEAAQKFAQAVGAGMQQGKTFDTMAAAQFVKPKALAPFTLNSPSSPDVTNKTSFEQLQYLAGRMHPGQFSPFIPDSDGGYILYVKDHLAVDQTNMQQQLPSYLARMREKLQVAAFNTWFSKQYRMHFEPSPFDRQRAMGGG